MDVKAKYPEAYRIAKLFEELGERQRWGDAPNIVIEISGGKARVVVLNEKDARVHDLTEAREKKRRDRHLGQPPDTPTSVPKTTD